MSELKWKDIVKVLTDNQQHMNEVVTVYDRTTGTEYSVELVDWANDEGEPTLGIMIGDLT
jgi:hypothetical protein